MLLFQMMLKLCVDWIYKSLHLSICEKYLVYAITNNSNYKMVAPGQEQGEFRDVNTRGLQMDYICHTTSH